jgi:hypothetical protein
MPSALLHPPSAEAATYYAVQPVCTALKIDYQP